MKLVRALRDDPLLAAVTLFLTLLAWLPLTKTPLLPFADLHNNAGAAALLFDTALERGTPGRYYEVNWAPIPYWTAYLVMAPVSALFGTLAGAKAIVALLLAVMPLALMRLLLALGRDPRLGLWAFALSWERNLYGGWVTFLLGMAIALWTLAWIIEMRTFSDALRVMPLSVLVALTHPQALAMLLFAGAALALTGRPVVLAALRNALALSTGLVAVLPWMRRRLESAPPDLDVEDVPVQIVWHSPAEKAANLFDYTFGHFPAELYRHAPAFAFLVLLIGPLVIASFTRPRAAARDRGAALVLLLTAVALYMALPFGFGGVIQHKHTYPRYASFILMTALLLPRPNLSGRRALALLLPGVAAAVAMDLTVLRQFEEFGRNARPFVDIMRSVRLGSRVLPVIFESKDPCCKIAPYNQFHAYVAGATRGYDPYFFDNDAVPVLYRRNRRIPVPRWFQLATKLDERHVKRFDYVLVQGLAQDPFQPGARLEKVRVRLIKEAGMWRLYAVKR